MAPLKPQSTMPSTQAIQTGRPKKLLSLDGGGIKGVSGLLILREIMKEVARIEDGHAVIDQSKSVGTKSPERKPMDYFDLTGGTSTGGIMAIMLSRLEMDCTEAIAQYEGLAADIFAVRIGSFNISKIPIINKLSPVVLGIKTLLGISQFSSKYLDHCIVQILKQYLPEGDCVNSQGEAYLVEERYKPYDATGKMLMCATMADRGKALLFRDYTPPADAIPETASGKNDEDPPPPASPYPGAGIKPDRPLDKTKLLLHDFNYSKVTIRQAVRATSAAPTYLPSEKIQKIDFWDGGLLNNNPIDQAWAARYDLTPQCTDEPYVSTVVSMGTTYNDPPLRIRPGLIAKILGIVDFASNTEAKHMDFKRNIYRRNLRQPKDQQTNYFRFNAPVGEVQISLADFRKMDFIKQKTVEYLALKDTREKITKCATELAKRGTGSSST